MKSTILIAVLFLTMVGCGASGGGSDGSPDSLSQDLFAADLVPDALADLVPEVVPLACLAPGLVGTIQDPAGAPIPGVRLFLCGQTEGGQASCLTRSTDETGAFAFSALEAGFSHVQINAVVAGDALGRLFGGVSLELDLYGLGECQDLGRLTLPEFASPPAPTSAAQALTLTADWLRVEVPAGTLAFPDYADEAVVMLTQVPQAQSPLQPAEVFFAFAMIPHGSLVPAGATVRLKAGQFATAPRLVTNSADTGQIIDLPALVPDQGEWAWKLEASLPELTWLWILPQ
jgi:hypothetical protein